MPHTPAPITITSYCGSAATLPSAIPCSCSPTVGSPAPWRDKPCATSIVRARGTSFEPRFEPIPSGRLRPAPCMARPSGGYGGGGGGGGGPRRVRGGRGGTGSFEEVLANAVGGDERAFALLWRWANPSLIRWLSVVAPGTGDD